MLTAFILSRGKRITYDAPITSVFPPADSDDEELERTLGAKSGPRVLFPAHPPTPPSSSSHEVQVTPPATMSISHMMQTPARSGKAKPSAFVTPALPRVVGTGDADKASKPADKAPRRDIIPPTPASLPQTKPDPANRPHLDDARSRLERERRSSLYRIRQRDSTKSGSSLDTAMHRGAQRGDRPVACGDICSAASAFEHYMTARIRKHSVYVDSFSTNHSCLVWTQTS